MDKKKAVLAAMLLAAFLWGCWGRTDKNAGAFGAEQVAMIVTEDTIGQLEQYPNLKKADLRGSSCYGAIESYRESHPEVEVAYNIWIGGVSVPADADAIVLEEGSYTPELLIKNLPHLRRVEQISFPNTELSPEQILQLKKANSHLRVEYSVALPGQTVPGDAAYLNLNDATEESVDQILEKLPMLPNIDYMELMGSDLTLDQLWQVQQAAPEAFLHCKFSLFGRELTTEDSLVEYTNLSVGNDGEEELRQALDLMQNCSRIVLDNCGFSSEVLSQIREDYRERTKVVWRIWFAQKGSCLTDRTVIRYVYNLDNSNCGQLKYCEDAEYIDFGHNETLSDCSWAANMPKLRAIILSGSLIDSLEPFANCPDLEFLEIAYCSKVHDLSPLSSCKNLLMLNSSFTGVQDLSPLDELNLERLCSVSSRVPVAEQLRFQQLHPECLTLFQGRQPYGYGWRYERDGYTPTAYYALLRQVFHYPDATDTRW